MSDQTLVQCILCNGTVPVTDTNDVMTSHMQIQHRAYFNMEFMMAAFFLEEAELVKTMEYMRKLTNKDATDCNNDTDVLNNTEDNNIMKDDSEQMLDSSSEALDEQVDISDAVNEESLLPNTVDEEHLHKKSRKIIKSEPQNDSEVENEQGNTITEVSQTNDVDNDLKKSRKRKRGTTKKNVLTKNRSNICPDCGKVFSNFYLANGHRRLVHDDTLHVCHLCSREIRGDQYLKIHLKRFHKALETCTVCGKLVKKLHIHMATMHTRDEDKKYRCQLCGKGFPLKSKFLEHEATHRDIKPLRCRKSQSCSYAFASGGNRRKHEQTHEKSVVKEEITVPDTNNKIGHSSEALPMVTLLES